MCKKNDEIKPLAIKYVKPKYLINMRLARLNNNIQLGS